LFQHYYVLNIATCPTKYIYLQCYLTLHDIKRKLAQFSAWTRSSIYYIWSFQFIHFVIIGSQNIYFMRIFSICT